MPVCARKTSKMAEPDSYSQIATNILMEKRARKMAEEDALRLYNRVRQLQKEEDKAEKRISDTKRKAKEIVKLRERNELLRQEKEERMRELQELIESQRVENLRIKDESVRAKTEMENKLYAEKVQVVQQTKEERAELEKLLAESKLLSRKEALEQKESVRKAQEEARRRLEQLKVSKLQSVRGHMWRGALRPHGRAWASRGQPCVAPETVQLARRVWLLRAAYRAGTCASGVKQMEFGSVCVGPPCHAAALSRHPRRMRPYSAAHCAMLHACAHCVPGCLPHMRRLRTTTSGGCRMRWTPSCPRSGRSSAWWVRSPAWCRLHGLEHI